MFKIHQRMRAYSLYVTHTLDIHRLTRYTLKVHYAYAIQRCQYAIHTFVEAIGGVLKTVFLIFAYAI